MNPSSAHKGRGAQHNPQNRFEKTHYELIEEDENAESDRKVKTQFFRDTTKSAFAKNDSSDIFFTYDLNPYRGCEHGCIYCYARPSHEYLGFSAGLDFETKIMVKENIPHLLEKEFKKKTWKPQIVLLGGNTDCYQPVEQRLQLTRKCLDVFRKFQNPVDIITKNYLITRDKDILTDLAVENLVHCTLTITTLDKKLQSKMEPRTSPPEMRLKAIEELSKAGIPVAVNIAPIIPGLNDSEIPAILKRAQEHGATGASWIMIRLPFAVKDLFTDWLRKTYPERAEKIINRIKDVRSGKLNETEFGKRMTGSGEIADSISQLFDLTSDKLGLAKLYRKLSVDKFQNDSNSQMELGL
jgi:DNA repair photolyase